MSDEVQTTQPAISMLGSLIVMTKALQMRNLTREADEMSSQHVREEGGSVADEGLPDREHGSAAEFLGDWRAAERDTLAAKTAASVAALTVAAAAAAEDAAAEAESAAAAAMDAATRAKSAADHAKKAAAHAAEAAQMASSTALGDKARADQSVQTAERAEGDARDRFHDAEDQGFPKK